MLKLEILTILRDPSLTMDQQADMLANMVVRRCGDMSRYVKGNARRAIMREREESARAVADAFERGWDQGYEDCADHYEEAKRLGTDIAF